jgi:hypothetical protein
MLTCYLPVGSSLPSPRMRFSLGKTAMNLIEIDIQLDTPFHFVNALHKQQIPAEAAQGDSIGGIEFYSPVGGFKANIQVLFEQL